MNFWGRMFFLIELKNRALITICCWVFTFFVLYMNKDDLLFDISKTIVSKNQSGSDIFYFIFTSPSDVLTVHLQVVSALSHFLTFAILLHNILSFFAPSLSIFFLKRLAPFSGLTLKLKVFLVFGVVRLVFLPFMATFLLSFSLDYNSRSPNPLFYEASVSHYINFCLFALSCSFVSAFSLFFFSALGRYYKKYNIVARQLRSLYYGFSCSFSAFVVAYDLISQFLGFGVLLVLFEYTVFVWSISEAGKLIDKEKLL